jgi:hypothetical protein
MMDAAGMKRIIQAVAALLSLWNVAWAQECPTPNGDGSDTSSLVRPLEGHLVYHNGLRQWFELRLKPPQCGQSSMQLVPATAGDWKAIERLRGCRVKARGSLDFSMTGYYSAEIYQAVEQIEAIGPCSPQPPLFAAPKPTPDAAVQAYRVVMRVNYRSGDHPIIFRVTQAGKELTPWQAYAGYFLTGSYVLYGMCGEGFVVDTVFGTPEAKPSHFDEPRSEGDRAAFDPESAAAAGKLDLRLGFTCVRGGDQMSGIRNQ